MVTVSRRNCQLYQSHCESNSDLGRVLYRLLGSSQYLCIFVHVIPYIDIHDDTSTVRRCHPSAWPHVLHILSTTRIFSSRPSRGSSRSPTSSKRPSLSRLRGGSHVSPYCRRDDTESSNK